MKPTHRLKVLDKITERANEVGAGWQNEDGSISIQLNLCVELASNPNLVITLFPVIKKD